MGIILSEEIAHRENEEKGVISQTEKPKKLNKQQKVEISFLEKGCWQRKPVRESQRRKTMVLPDE